MPRRSGRSMKITLLNLGKAEVIRDEGGLCLGSRRLVF